MKGSKKPPLNRRRKIQLAEISVRKQSEWEASAQATRLRMALEAAEMVTWEWDIPGDTIRYSENLPAIVRGDALEPYTSITRVMQQVHPEDRKPLAEAVNRTLKEGVPFECEYRVRMLDGIYRWILGRGKIVINEGDKPVRVLGVSQEITQRKQVELVLQLQRDLATALSMITELDTALDKILEMALAIHGVDGGGIYLEQSNPPGLRLCAHRGLMPAFTSRVAFYPPDSSEAKLLSGHKAWYALSPELRAELDPVLALDGILGVAVVPLYHEQRLIGCLNLASRHCREIPEPSQVLIEALAAQAASAIARIQSEQQRKRLEREILEISDREQARFGQDLHDGLCQQLVGAAFDVNDLTRQLAKRSLPEATTAERLAGLLDQAITESRRLARGLYPVKLDAEGLISALEELAATSRARAGIACLVRCAGRLKVKHHAAAIHLYRIAQEAVNNAIKHSGARRVIVELTASSRFLRLEIRDDGRGISKPAGASTSMGMQIMSYRAHSLGGALTVTNSPEGGTLVTCCVPRASL